LKVIARKSTWPTESPRSPSGPTIRRLPPSKSQLMKHTPRLRINKCKQQPIRQPQLPPIHLPLHSNTVTHRNNKNNNLLLSDTHNRIWSMKVLTRQRIALATKSTCRHRTPSVRPDQSQALLSHATRSAAVLLQEGVPRQAPRASPPTPKSRIRSRTQQMPITLSRDSNNSPTMHSNNREGRASQRRRTPCHALLNI